MNVYDIFIIFVIVCTVHAIISHVDILITFFPKHILPIPNPINLNNYYSFCI